MPLNESVLVIPTGHFCAVGYFHGFQAAEDGYVGRLLDARQFSFRPRSEVETDPSFKQLVPYVVLRCGGELFHYRRGEAGTEKRLESLRSIGIGGHISEADAAATGDPYRTGMLRELAEEIDLGGPYTERLFGFINDDRTPVGSVHLGVVHLFELERPAAASREDAIAGAGFAPLHNLLDESAEFESWSQFVLAELGRSA